MTRYTSVPSILQIKRSETLEALLLQTWAQTRYREQLQTLGLPLLILRKLCQEPFQITTISATEDSRNTGVTALERVVEIGAESLLDLRAPARP